MIRPGQGLERSHGLSGRRTDAQTESAASSAPRLLWFAFLSLWFFFLCVIKTRAVCGRGPSVHLLPPVPHLLGGQRHLEPAGSIAAGWILGRSLPGGRPAWTCSPVQRGNTHEPRALLTLLSPGVQMRLTSLKKAGLGFQKPKSFFFFFFKLTVTNVRVLTGDVIFTPLFTAGTVGWLPVCFCC